MEATRKIGSDELTGVMKRALEDAEGRCDDALDALDRLDRGES